MLRYGIFERCRELVEAGYDVRQPDKENVTLLHWAAINNRLDLVKYVSICVLLVYFIHIPLPLLDLMIFLASFFPLVIKTPHTQRNR